MLLNCPCIFTSFFFFFFFFFVFFFLFCVFFFFCFFFVLFFFLFFFKAMGILLTPLSIRLPVTLSSKTTGRKSTKLATSLPLMVRVCKNKIIFLCVRPCVRRSSICMSHYLLLNHWAEFNQSCHITSPHG